jgi:hypothetical protein
MCAINHYYITTLYIEEFELEVYATVLLFLITCV